MKQIIYFLLVILISGCSKPNKKIYFEHIPKEKLKGFLFSIPDTIPYNAAKKTHDSCMGFSFDANAMFIKTRNTFFIGDVVNKRSLKISDKLADLGLTRSQMISEFNVDASPCTEKYNIGFSLKSALGENFELRLQNESDVINKEINDAIAAANTFMIQAGPWIYLDINDALKNRLDTALNSTAVKYKIDALDSSNIVLISVEAITYMTFIVHSAKPLSKQLITLLKQKPFALQQQDFSIQLAYKDDNSFDLSLNGMFPVAGEFVKAKSK